MLNYRTNSYIAAGLGFFLIAIGSLSMMNSTSSFESHQQASGTVLLTLGAVFLGIMASLQLTGQSTEQTARMVIGILKQEGLIPNDSDIRITKDLRVVKSVTKTLKSRFDIEKPYWKCAI